MDYGTPSPAQQINHFRKNPPLWYILLNSGKGGRKLIAVVFILRFIFRIIFRFFGLTLTLIFLLCLRYIPEPNISWWITVPAAITLYLLPTLAKALKVWYFHPNLALIARKP